MADQHENNSSRALEGIQFVHCAIPDMSLSQADTTLGVGNGSALGCPIVVRSSSEKEAREASAGGGYAAAFEDKHAIRLFVNGSEAAALAEGHSLIDVGDGLEAAKVLRIYPKAIPAVGAADSKAIATFVKQLKIAMFLTNSRSIDELRAAPVYKTGD